MGGQVGGTGGEIGRGDKWGWDRWGGDKCGGNR